MPFLEVLPHVRGSIEKGERGLGGCGFGCLVLFEEKKGFSRGGGGGVGLYVVMVRSSKVLPWGLGRSAL